MSTMMDNYFEKKNEESQFIIKRKKKAECLSSKFDCQES